MSRRARQDADRLTLAGRNPVREALEAGTPSLERVYLQKGSSSRAIDGFRGLAEKAGVPVQYVPAQKLDRLAGGAAHQGVVAVGAEVAYLDLDVMLSRVAPTREAVQGARPLLVVLDQIEDPHNFGAILRSALAFGARGVIVPAHHMAPLSATTIKASAGAALRIPIARVTNVAEALERLKERGYWVAGAAGEGAESAWTLDWARPLALVIGNEGRGLRRRVADVCDHLVRIPMRGPMESLNASVAAGVLLAAASRGREAEAGD